MSGVYIPMEMPISCDACPFHKLWSLDEPLQCLVNLELWCDSPERHKLCPLVPVPDHGRIIDADALIEKDNKDYNVAMRASMSITTKSAIMRIHEQMQAVISEAPTIIPADFAKDTNVPTKAADKEGKEWD